jgi:hypothetical protein
MPDGFPMEDEGSVDYCLNKEIDELRADARLPMSILSNNEVRRTKSMPITAHQNI